MKILVSDIKVKNRIRKDMGDLTDLKESIKKLGLLQPLGVEPRNEKGYYVLLFGERRLRALKQLKWESIPVTVIKTTADLAVYIEGDENECRKDFNPSEKLVLAERIEEIVAKAAKERQLATLKKGTVTPRPGNLPERTAGQTRDIIAKTVGWTGKTYEKAKTVADTEKYGYITPEDNKKYKKAIDIEDKKVTKAKEQGETYKPKPIPKPKPIIPASKFKGIVESMDETSVEKAYKEVKQIAIEHEAEKIRKQPPTKQIKGIKYDVLVIDPPWQYEKRKDDTTHRARNLYPTMTTDEICDWGLDLPANKDCVLWLWTTNAFMHDAYHVLEAWGFEPKTILTWVKNKMGLGDWLRGITEHCIIATKGKPKVTLNNQTTVLNAPIGKHSEKPSDFFVLVEGLCIARNKAEYFSRTKREGWHVFGNEVGDDS